MGIPKGGLRFIFFSEGFPSYYIPDVPGPLLKGGLKFLPFLFPGRSLPRSGLFLLRQGFLKKRIGAVFVFPDNTFPPLAGVLAFLPVYIRFGQVYLPAALLNKEETDLRRSGFTARRTCAISGWGRKSCHLIRRSTFFMVSLSSFILRRITPAIFSP